jgi:hypothetical protein
MGNGRTTGVPVMIITHCHLIAQGRAPPLVVLHRWPGELSYTNVHEGLFLTVTSAFACLLA